MRYNQTLGNEKELLEEMCFSAANRQFGRDIGQTRQGLLDELRSKLSEAGHEDLSKQMQHGQNRYRQYMNLRKYRDAAGLALATQSFPQLNVIKKFLP